MPTMTGSRTGASRRRRGGGALVVGLCLLLAGCAGVAHGPTYTDAELKAICERQGGWWRGELIPGFCEFQTASISQAP